MTDNTGFNRRSVMRAIGGTAVAVSLAGCGGNGDEEPETVPDEIPDEVHTFLAETHDARMYDTDILDATAQDTVTIDVGAGDAGFAFSPAAIRVTTGTTVSFEWTGAGGGHNIVAAEESDIDVDPETEIIDEEGHSVEETFDEAGNYLYICEPHIAQGKVGAIVVE